MRLLVVSLSAPVPANAGHKMRNWSVLRALAEDGHRVTLLTFADPAEEFDLTAVRKVCDDIIVVPLQMQNLTSKTNYAGRIASLFSNKPYAIRRFASAEMRLRVESELASGSYGATICESAYATINVPQTGTPIVLDNHNVEHLILARYSAFERNPVKRLYAALEARRLRSMERKACKRATVSLCCSEADRRHFQQLRPEGDFRVVPNCIDVGRYSPTRCEEPRTVLYQGGMDWFPNRDAVEFFVESMLPQLREAVPDLKFVIAGRNPSAEFRARLSMLPGVVVTGTVPDMRPVIDRAMVCVVPLRIGSGTRLKILEAAAMGKAIVSTSIGAEGLEFVDGREIMLADTPEEFISATTRLLLNPDLRIQMGRAARVRVEQAYSFSALRQSLRFALGGVEHTSSAARWDGKGH